MNALWHEIVGWSKLIGVRDRLRCPRCKAVGTWKPHGGWFDRHPDGRNVRRWLCKWCGLYIGPEGVKQAVVGENPFWELLDHCGTGHTPYTIMEGYNIDPWKG